MTDIGVATRVHMREERALSKYRLARGRFLLEQSLGFATSRRFAKALYWRGRWTQGREIIDAEERRAKVAADVYDCVLCGQRYVRSAVPTSCTVLHSPGSCCHYGEMAA